MKFKVVVFLITIAAIVIGLILGTGAMRAKKRQQKVADLVALAESSLAAGDFEEALSASREVIEDFGVREDLDRLHALMAQSYAGLERGEEAIAQWQKILDEYPQSRFAPDATIAVARDLLERGGSANVDAAHELFRKVESQYPETGAYSEALFGFAEISLLDGDLVEAQRTLYRLIDEAPDSVRRADAEEMLGDVNIRLLRSNRKMDGEEYYTVQPGDNLEKIGKMFSVNYEIIMLVNGIDDPKKLRPDKRLKIPDLDFSIVVDKGDNTLTLLNHGKFFKRYLVRTGEHEEQTPSGEYAITDKERDPVWFYDGAAIPAGHPENELGTRWMAFKGKSLGIHGTIHPDTIGQYASNGCVGMLKADVEELYDLVPKGTPVKIEGVRQSARNR
jgi:tetratricopeptide (TPR) repeat protein